ncbi:MAG: hypothetical protein RL651_755 [Pseudomonadota bacterium]|jgi:type I restriction enzyme S subunit
MNQATLDIGPVERRIVTEILRRHVPDADVLVFGSRATGKAKKFSDLDLCIKAAKPLGLDLSSALAEDFAQSDLPWKVDVVDWATTSEAFRRIIEKDSVPLRIA